MNAAVIEPGIASAVGTVFVVAGRDASDEHGEATRLDLARRLAELMGYAFGGIHTGEATRYGHSYLIPADTLLESRARQLGVRGEQDLFGGVVPHAFLTTKTISHPAVDALARVPVGWSHQLAHRIGDAVLPGYSAFTYRDARLAGERLLERGDVRVKTGNGIGGSGQTVVATGRQLVDALDTLPPGDILDHGVVIEPNLDQPVTYSVGCLRVGEWKLAYHGTQQSTRDHAQREVYGGSDLVVVRGGFDALLAEPLAPELRTAIEHARRYDAAVAATHPGFFASRRNYDVVAGHDSAGVRRCGVLEQSWRIGGASPAEIAALAALHADPSLQRVRASCHEVYSGESPPIAATIHFRGQDGRAGMLCKYSMVEEARAP